MSDDFGELNLKNIYLSKEFHISENDSVIQVCTIHTQIILTDVNCYIFWYFKSMCDLI